MANLKVTLVKSTIGAVPKHKKTVEALGLKKLNKTVVLPDNAATRWPALCAPAPRASRFAALAVWVAARSLALDRKSVV